MVIKNEFLDKLVLVPEGYEICPRCKGLGYHPKYDTFGDGTILECTLCDSEGFVDWITYIKNKDWEKKDIEEQEELEKEKMSMN